MTDKRKFGVEERKGICAKEYGVESKDNLVIS